MKNRIISALLSSLLVVSLSACGSPTSTSTPETSEGSAVSTSGTLSTTNDELSGEFTFFHYHEEDGAGTSKAFWDAANKFKEEHPNVKIDYSFTDSNDYEEKLTTLMAGDELPDVWLTKGDMLSTFADGDLIQSADQYISADSDWENCYVDGAFADCTYDGKQWGVPFQMQSNCIGIYNQAIMDECGISEWPDTWTELLDDCKKIKEAGYTPIGMGNKDQWVAESAVFNTYAYRYVDQDWFTSLANNQGAKFTDDAFVKALTGFQNIAQYFNSDMNSTDQDEMYSLYYNKKCAMFFDGAWAVGTMISNCPSDVLADTHVGLMPAVDGEPGTKYDTASGAGWNYVINSDLSGNDLDACLAFLKVITTGDYADDALAQGFISAAKTTDNCDMSTLPPLFSEYYDLASQMNNCSIFDCVLPAAVGSGILYADTQELIANSITPEAMAEDCQSALEASE